MGDAAPPLTWETSTDTRPQISRSLPEPVVSCLQNARFLHLATCTDLQPHVSLMNYTYLPSHPFDNPTDQPDLDNTANSTHLTNHVSQPSSLPPGPIILMTTNPSSRKTLNLVTNPNVSLLVHDWVSHRPATARSTSPEGHRRSNPGGTGGGGLAALLMGMNSMAMGSISATINGTATVLERGSEEEKWCKRAHLENNTFEEGGQQQQQGLLSSSPGSRTLGDGGRECFIEDEDVRVVVVRIRDGRIADWKGGVRDWVLEAPDGQSRAGLVDGIR